MTQDEVEKAIKEQRVFKIGKSFLFTVQIPDNSGGISGSRCLNSGGKVAYCEQVCKHCKLPFVGPFGFRQITEWGKLSPADKEIMVVDIYITEENQGRLGSNVLPFPLHPSEMRRVEKLSEDDFLRLFCRKHFI